MMSELDGKREEKYLELITTLNERRQQGSRGIFNCGKLGFALIYWSRYGWNVEWFEPIDANVYLRARRR